MNSSLLKTLWNRVVDSGGDDLILGRLTEEGRELIVSTSSLTTAIEALYGSHLSVEVNESACEVLIDDYLSDYLGLPLGSTALEREVYLCVGGRRVVYAHSVFALSAGEEETALRAMLASNEPLGRSLAARNVPFEKDKLEVALVEDGELTLDGNGSKAPLIARRYRLFSSEGSDININGALIEVFAPTLIRVG